MAILSDIEEISATRRKMKVVIPAESVKSAIQKKTEEIQKTAEIRGFRKGKAPLSLIAKFYAQDIFKKAADDVVQEAYKEVSRPEKHEKFQIVSFPHIEPENTFDGQKDFQFSATVDISPVIEIKDYKEIPLQFDERLNINLEEEIERLLDSFAKNLGKTEELPLDHCAGEGDVVKLSYTLSHEGQTLANRGAKDQLIELGSVQAQTLVFESALAGMKAGEHRVFPFTYSEEFQDPELSGKQVEIHLDVSRVSSLTPLAKDDELAKKMGFQTLDEVKKNIEETLKKGNADIKANLAYPQIVDHIIAKNEFEVAESLVDSTIDKAINEYNAKVPKEQALKIEDESVRAQYLDQAMMQVKGVLALGHIARQEGLSISNDEVLQEFYSFAASHQLDPKQLYKRGGQAMMDEFRGQVMIRKVVAHLIESARIEYVKK